MAHEGSLELACQSARAGAIRQRRHAGRRSILKFAAPGITQFHFFPQFTEASVEAFLSWSGDVSKEVALAMHDWLPDIIQPLKPWMSDKDLPKGTRWNEEIGKKLGALSIGIFFLTADNLNSGWIHFEAGAVAKTVEDSRVFTYLFGLEYREVGYPLAQFNHTKAIESDTLKMLQDINNLLPANERVEDKRLERLFKQCWPRLEEKLKEIAARVAEPKATVQKRQSEDILNEILELTRGLARRQGELSTPPEGVLPMSPPTSPTSKIPESTESLPPTVPPAKPESKGSRPKRGRGTM
jgi:hypothetical protein